MDSVPEADDIAERFERFIFDFDLIDYNAFSVEDEEDKRLVQAIKQNDVTTVDEILTAFSKDPAKEDFRFDGTPILLLAVVEGNCDIINCVIDHGCDVRDTDWSGNSPLHMAVWNRRTPYYYHSRWSRNEPTCKGCDLKLHRLDIVEILLQAYSNDSRSAFENVFVDTNRNGVTPFLRACAAGCDATIARFLNFLDKFRPKFLTTEIFADTQGNNIFHYILDSSTYHMTAARIETVEALIEKVSLSKELLNEQNCSGITPLEILARPTMPDWPQIGQLMKVLLANGANPDVVTIDGSTLLCSLIKHPKLVEILLRAGCSPDLCCRGAFSPLSLALSRHRKESTRPSIATIELLLAFDANLEKELYLYSPEERPDEFDATENASLCDAGNIETDVLKALIKIRRSNILLNLKRICRRAVRSYLKPTADERIKILTGVPDSVKSYLLLENEPPLLGITE